MVCCAGLGCGDTGGDVSLLGSYDVRLAARELPRARIDIVRGKGGELQARVYRKAAWSGTYSVEESAEEVILRKDTTFSGQGEGVIHEITIERGERGRLAGALVSHEEFHADDYDGEEDLEGVVGPDVTPPVLSISHKSERSMPWHPLVLDLSEPIHRDQIEAMAPDGLIFSASPANPEWSDRIVVTLADWRQGMTGTMPLMVADPAGNISAPFAWSVDFRGAGKPRSGLDFDSGEIPPLNWGNVQRMQDASCEAGGCAKLAWSNGSDCHANSGFAFTVPEATKQATIRFRVFPDQAVQSESPHVIVPLLLDLPGAEVTDLDWPDVAVTRVSVDGGLAWVSAWQEMTIDVAGLKQVGAALRVQVGGCPDDKSDTSVALRGSLRLERVATK